MISISDYARNMPLHNLGSLGYKLLGHLQPECYVANSIYDFKENSDSLLPTPSFRRYLSPLCWNYAPGEVIISFRNTHLEIAADELNLHSFIFQDFTGTLPVLFSHRKFLKTPEDLTSGMYKWLYIGYCPNKSCWLLNAEKFGSEAPETSLETVVGDFSFSF